MGRWKIYGIMMMVILAWGLNVVATKQLVAAFAPTTMTAFRILVAGVFVLCIMGLLGHVRKLTWREVRMIFIACLFSVVLHHYFLSLGLTKTAANQAGLILGLVPILTSLLSVLLLGERLTWFRLVGLVSGFVGVALIVMRGTGGPIPISVGDLYIFLSALAQAISFILIKKATGTLDGRVLTGWMLVFGAVILLGIGSFTEPQGLASMRQADGGIWLLFFASSLIATGLGHMTYNRIVQHLGASETAIFINFSPFFSLVGSALILGETIGAAQWFGFVFIVFGVLCGTGVIGQWAKRTKVGPKRDKLAS
ncbi:DMT family transporter [Laceyella putida]|uniref:DMT family transporter n=1 Tax=Laceyella putida TaxID=110101 RepID=A0ABW2RL44_9BACL